MNRSQRFQTKERVNIEVFGRLGTSGAQVKNISLTGAFLELNKGAYGPKKGDLVSLTVKLGELGRTYILSAEVVWTQNLGLGVCFINKEEVLERIVAKSNGF